MSERILYRKPSHSRLHLGLRQQRQKTSRMFIEALEDRLMMASGEPGAISVGRTLSAWTVSDVQHNELKINYTVYNEQESAISAVQLVTTLQPGVSFESTTGIAQRNGQQITWNLGTLSPLGSA